MRKRDRLRKREKCSPSGSERPSKRQGWWIGRREGGWRSMCRTVSIYLAFCRVPEYVLYLQAARVFQDVASRVLTRNVFIMRSASKLRAPEGGLPLSMNPMRGGGSAAVCTREHKADFQWFTSSHQTHTARIAVKTPSAAVFHSSARFSCPDRFHSCLAKVGGRRVSRWNRERSVHECSFATTECMCVGFAKLFQVGDFSINLSKLQIFINQFILSH